MYMPKFELLSFSSLSVQRKQLVLRAMLESLIVADVTVSDDRREER